MEINQTEVVINGVEYIRKDSVESPLVKAESLNGMDYVLVRTKDAGVFAGYLFEKTAIEVVVKQARRIWFWDGAASLSQLAMDGTSKPSSCKFPCEVGSITLSQWIEIIPCTNKAMKSIKGVPIWKQ